MHGPPALFLHHTSLKTGPKRTWDDNVRSEEDSESEDYEKEKKQKNQELDEQELAIERVYNEHNELLVSTWKLGVVEELDILKQFVSLYIYQYDNPKMMKTLNKFYEARHQGTEFTVSTQLTVEMLLKDKKTRPPILALMFVDHILQEKPNIPFVEEELLAYLPKSVVDYLKGSNKVSSENIRLVEILLLRGLCRTRVPTDLELKSPPDQFADLIMECEAYPVQNLTSNAHTPRKVFDFYQRGLELAFKNPKMQTHLSDGTLLYHGLELESPDPQVVKSKIRGLTSAPLSTTIDPNQARSFARSYVLNLKIPAGLSAIVYCTLDRNRGRSGALWNKMPDEREVLFPPGVVYSPENPPSNITAWGVPYWDVECSVGP